MQDLHKQADSLTPTTKALADASTTAPESKEDSAKPDGGSEKAVGTEDSRAEKDTSSEGPSPTVAEPVDSETIREHVNEHLDLAPPLPLNQTTTTTAPPSVTVPPMLRDHSKWLTPQAQGLLETIPGAKKSFRENGVTASSPDSALWETLSELYDGDGLENLPATVQHLFRNVADAYGFEFLQPKPGEAVHPDMVEVVEKVPTDEVPPGTVVRVDKPGLVNPVTKEVVKARVAVAEDPLSHAKNQLQQPAPTPGGKQQPPAPEEEPQKVAEASPDHGAIAKSVREGAEKTKKVYYGEEKPTPAARVIQGGLGSGMALSNLPILAKALRGKPLLWHGTSQYSAQSILNNQDPKMRGIKLKFAGKAARANGSLLANSVIREVESVGIPLSIQQMASLYERLIPRIERQEEKRLEKMVAEQEDLLSEERFEEAQGAAQQSPRKTPYDAAEGCSADCSGGTL